VVAGFNGIAWSIGYSSFIYSSFIRHSTFPEMPNQIQIIAPYRAHGTWVFDDPAADLVQEPFVNGIPEMIDDLVQSIPDAASGFRMLFSPAPFPGFQRKLTWVREEMGGNWYQADHPPIEGWLCPALFKYFAEAPRELYVRAESRTQRSP
jgi:hypothetical protein